VYFLVDGEVELYVKQKRGQFDFSQSKGVCSAILKGPEILGLEEAFTKDKPKLWNSTIIVRSQQAFLLFIDQKKFKSCILDKFPHIKRSLFNETTELTKFHQERRQIVLARHLANKPPIHSLTKKPVI
jgi:CRP-like cAMP-binding protein